MRRDLVAGKIDVGSLLDIKYINKVTDRVFKIGERLDYFLATGNLRSDTGLDLMQATGFTVLAEKLNYLRFMSHFRAVHRGAFFATMKTTTVRKLLPESWGFFCPVHTPDGAPCGLLNHLAVECFIQTRAAAFDPTYLVRLLCSYGMQSTQAGVTYPHQHLTVLLDGRVVGKVSPSLAEAVCAKLRHIKVTQELPKVVPAYLEIAYVPRVTKGLFAGIYLWSEMSRLLRPVRYLPTNSTEYISSFEQVYMHVACLPDDARPHTSHIEFKPTNMLSMIANLTPFSNHNQSPRNMYQCQMAKQTMATPCHTFPYRTDNKMFRLQTPQRPIVRSETYTRFNINDYPLGANAVVAVISYTGYDMEDAMIINKSAYERGFAHASVYKHEVVDVYDFRPKNDRTTKYYFSNLDEGGNIVCVSFCISTVHLFQIFPTFLK
jgi:DNA-directed RNA polymerase I subunit RPA2